MSIRQRLYPTPDQSAVLEMHCAHSRFVWNLALEQFNLWRRDKHTRGPRSAVAPNQAVRMRQLAEARAVEPWLALGSSAVQQAALRDFEQAIKQWFRGSRGRPTWRKAGLHTSFVVRDLRLHRLNRKWAELTIPKVGRVRFRLTRPWQMVVSASSARVKVGRDGRWHVSLVCPPPRAERAATGASVGIDRGVMNTIATSDGVLLAVPRITREEQLRLEALQRQHSRQQPGSKRRERTRRSIARLNSRLHDRRYDWVEQNTTRLVRQYDLIALRICVPLTWCASRERRSTLCVPTSSCRMELARRPPSTGLSTSLCGVRFRSDSSTRRATEL